MIVNDISFSCKYSERIIVIACQAIHETRLFANWLLENAALTWWKNNGSLRTRSAVRANPLETVIVARCASSVAAAFAKAGV